ncbi:MAG: DUF1501 domain-containing protein [Phycisphaeraceae bacterium]
MPLMSRRGFLQFGSLAACGLSLSGLMQPRAQAAAIDATRAAAAAQDKAVILVWLPGGISHIDTFDMKPFAGSEIRGDFRPIRTNVSGIEICELFPRLAKVADKYTIIRSICHEFADHGGGHKRFLTGRKPAQPDGFVNDAPAVTSIINKQCEARHAGLPNVVAFTDRGREGVDVFSLGSAYLGSTCDPFMVGGNPAKPDFQVRNLTLSDQMAARLDDRLALLKGLDRLKREVDSTQAMSAMDSFNQRAFELLTGPKARIAFDLAKEPDSIRDLYGRHAFGQRALLARRMIEAGSTFATVVMENPTPGEALPADTTYNWDSHAVNCHIFTDTRFRAPHFDQACSALITDIYQRGLDKKVMLIITGEFGRTPRVEYSDKTGTTRPGRDHWPSAMSMLVSGGGLRTGQIIGSTDAIGGHPKDRPMSPNDLWATVYRHLSIDPNATYEDHQGRPQLILPFGEPIRELIG